MTLHLADGKGVVENDRDFAARLIELNYTNISRRGMIRKENNPIESLGLSQTFGH